ncbi:hypothetical protein WKW80_22970 [Variovorax humicola]|uniref:Porin family protein n=1 Tax=Variovorax humicola TaxID=1769758 RepID=A0ABU8W640_9BURK
MLRAFASPRGNDVALRPDVRVPVPRQKMCAQRAIARLQFIGQLGGLLDLQYVKLGVSDQYLGGLAGGYNVTFKQTVATAAGFYRVVNGPAVQVDIVGGVRYVYITTNVDIAPSLRGFGKQIEDSSGSTSGIVGVRDRAARRKVVAPGLPGCRRRQLDHKPAAIAGASYQYSPATSIKFGYGYLGYKRDNDLVYKAAMGGLYVGLGFSSELPGCPGRGRARPAPRVGSSRDGKATSS